MNEKKSSNFIGILSMDRLFIGSKSEGLYPVLHTHNGQQFRLHYKGDLSLNEKTLSSYNGKTVEVVGTVDNLRGHWRIVLPTGSLPRISEASSTASLEEPKGAPHPGPQAALPPSTGDALELPPVLDPKETSSETNTTEE